MMCGYRNDSPPPIFDVNSPNVGKNGCGPGTHRALRSDFLEWVRSLAPWQLAEKTKSFSNGCEFSLTEHLFNVAAANTQSNLRELQDAAEYIENRMHGFWRFKGYDIDEETAADCIQMLRYFTMDNIRLTDEAIALLNGRFITPPQNRLEPLAVHHHSNPKLQNTHLEHLQTDFNDLAKRLRDLRARTETDINYFIARLSAKEAHRAQLQADELRWMNYAVFMLGPVSTLAAILALQERDRNVLVFLLCACGAGLVILMLRFWKSIPQVVGEVGERIRARREKSAVKDAEAPHAMEESLFDYLEGE